MHEHMQTYTIYGLTSVNHLADTKDLFIFSTDMLTKKS